MSDSDHIVGRSLFQRLDSGETIGPETPQPTVDDMARSVYQHLQELLNTRVGNAAAMNQYGLNDFNDMASVHTDFVKHIGFDIKRCITDYEPRLRDVRISHLPDTDRPLLLSFSVQAEMAVGDEYRKVSFDISLNGKGRLKVRR